MLQFRVGFNRGFSADRDGMDGGNRGGWGGGANNSNGWGGQPRRNSQDNAGSWRQEAMTNGTAGWSQNRAGSRDRDGGNWGGGGGGGGGRWDNRGNQRNGPNYNNRGPPQPRSGGRWDNLDSDNGPRDQGRSGWGQNRWDSRRDTGEGGRWGKLDKDSPEDWTKPLPRNERLES